MEPRSLNVEAIFLKAVEKAPAERAAFLHEACRGDAGLRAQVENLLRANDAAGSFLSRPAVIVDRRNDLDATLRFLGPCSKPGCIGLLGNYEIIEELGRGGMGIVLRGLDTKLNRIVAVKVLAEQLAANPTARRRFLREAQAAAAVTHDHVVRIYAVDDTGPLPYLVMECIEGCTLTEKIEKEGALSVKEILRIGKQLASGLAAAHKEGLIHRDIKPANILLENGVQRVKITDFGLARAIDEVGMTSSGVVTGTPLYMSPEQAAGKPVDFRSDLFSLGGVLYAMCTGKPPFRADSALAVMKRVCEEMPPPIHEVNSNIPDNLVQVIDKLLAKNPDDRFQSAGEVAELLGQHLARLNELSAGSQAAPGLNAAGRPPIRASRPKRFQWAIVTIVFLAVLAVFALTEVTGVTTVVSHLVTSTTGGADPGAGGTVQQPGDMPKESVAKQNQAPTFVNSAGMKFVKVPRGAFWMGGGKGSPGVKHAIIENDFYMGVWEVTQSQWHAVMGNNPSFFSRAGEGNLLISHILEKDLGQFPVENVSWNDVLDYIQKLNAKEHANGRFYRLPTEAEWEYACRGGAASQAECSFDFYFDVPTNDLSSTQANFHGNQPAGKAPEGPNLGRTSKAGSYQPNKFGLYDMHGNVCEWCSDSAESGSKYVIRGGHWGLSAVNCAAADFYAFPPSQRLNSVGFRLVCVLSDN